MSFQSFEYLRHDKSDYAVSIYKLIDDKFECEIKMFNEERTDDLVVNFIIAIIEEYERRHLDIGKNIALATIWANKTYGISIKDLLSDQRCMYLNIEQPWKPIAKSRDKWLKKLLIWS